jgi:transposase
MTYSEDLRKRVMAFIETGGSITAASERFKVSRWCIYDWKKRKVLAPERKRPCTPWKLNPEVLKAHVEAFPDAYQRERALALGVSHHAIYYGLKRLGITLKKHRSLRREKGGLPSVLPECTGFDSSRKAGLRR